MRTHGETNDCSDCRFWSEMLAILAPQDKGAVHTSCEGCVDTGLLISHSKLCPTCIDWTFNSHGVERKNWTAPQPAPAGECIIHGDKGCADNCRGKQPAPVNDPIKCGSCGRRLRTEDDCISLMVIPHCKRWIPKQPAPEPTPKALGSAQFSSSSFYALFKHMEDEHGLTLTDSELNEICEIVKSGAPAFTVEQIRDYLTGSLILDCPVGEGQYTHEIERNKSLKNAIAELNDPEDGINAVTGRKGRLLEFVI